MQDEIPDWGISGHSLPRDSLHSSRRDLDPKNVLIKDWERPEQYVEIITDQFRVLIFVVGEVDHTKVPKWPRWLFYTGFESEVHDTCLKYIDEHRPDELYAVLVIGDTARTSNYRNPLFERSKGQSDMLSKLKA